MMNYVHSITFNYYYRDNEHYILQFMIMPVQNDTNLVCIYIYVIGVHYIYKMIVQSFMGTFSIWTY